MVGEIRINTTKQETLSRKNIMNITLLLFVITCSSPDSCDMSITQRYINPVQAEMRLCLDKVEKEIDNGASNAYCQLAYLDK